MDRTLQSLLIGGALAIGVIIGSAFGKIMSALVNDVIMPLVSLILPNGEWRTAAFTIRERAPRYELTNRECPECKEKVA